MTGTTAKSAATPLATGTDIARLLNPGLTAIREWQPVEFAAILKHQLSAPVRVDLGELGADLQPKIATLCAAQGLLLRSFHDLFVHPSPPLELLRIVKEYAKTHRLNPRSPLPPEIAAVLYYSCIAAALVRLGQRISQTSDAELRKGWTWATRQPWLVPELHSLIVRALELLPP
jgi:hypothetical protein